MTRAHATKNTDPEKQFLLLLDHIHMIRTKVQWMRSQITIYVEHNLGFEVCGRYPTTPHTKKGRHVATTCHMITHFLYASCTSTKCRCYRDCIPFRSHPRRQERSLMCVAFHMNSSNEQMRGLYHAACAFPSLQPCKGVLGRTAAL